MTFLIVSPAYAPYSGVGANRMMSLTQYLVSKGYEVIVLRNSPETWPYDSLKSTPPDGVIVRDVLVTNHFGECVELYYKAIKAVYGDYSVECALYSCNPYYTIVAASKIKKETRSPFIIDFRDLWVNDETFTRNRLGRIRKIISRQRYRPLEKMCVASADRIVTVTPREDMELKKQYPKYASKMLVIYNGYDSKRLEKPITLDEKAKLEHFLDELKGYYSIGVFGKFGYYDYEYLIEFLKSVMILNEKGKKVKIVHIGELDERSKMAMRNVDFPSELYIGTGFLDYKTGVELLKHLTMNLLIVHYKRGLGTKLFDYIYVNKPVVFFAEKDSAIADVLRECRNSFRCEDSRNAEFAIKKIINDNLVTLGCPDKLKYSRKSQNEVYEKVLIEVGGKKHG